MVAASLMLLPAVGEPVTAQDVAVEDDARAAIADLLDRRSRAVTARDEEAFMATVAPDSHAFVERQRRLFRAMAGVPLGSYSLEANWARFGDLARPMDGGRYEDADDVSIPVTEERYRIRGYDEHPAVEDIFYTYVRRGDRWWIAEDTDLNDLTLYSARHLWDFGPVTKLERGRFLLLRHPCGSCGDLDAQLLDLAEQGLQRMDRYWPVRWHRKVVVTVPRTGEELGRMIQSTFDLDDFVAFAYSTVDVSDGIDYTGHRIIPNPRAFEGRDPSSIVDILAHELLHVATRAHAGPFVPIFVEEGFADYAGNDADLDALAFFNSEVAAGLFDATLPEDFEFLVGSGTDIYRSYQEGLSAVRFFIDRWGLNTFVRFYRKLGRVEIAAGTARYHLDRALRATTGLDFDAFERAWADTIRA